MSAGAAGESARATRAFTLFRGYQLGLLLPFAAMKKLQANVVLRAGADHTLYASDEEVSVPIDLYGVAFGNFLMHQDAHAGSREIGDLAWHRNIRVAEDGGGYRLLSFDASLFAVIHIIPS
jgi:hypothetical protein